MSSANILFYIAIGAFILSAVCLVLAIILFFRLDIRGVVGDLTGKTVAKEVQMMREDTKQSEASNERKRIHRGMTTSTNLSKSKILNKRQKMKEETKAVVLGEEGTTLLSQEEGTTLLSQGDNATTLLSTDDGATTLLNQTGDATTLLSSDTNETTLLSTDFETTLLAENQQREKVTFKICNSIVVIHTDEVIASE